MTTFTGTSADNVFVGSSANDVFNYGTVSYSGSTIVAARGFDTITSGGGYDILNFANLGIAYVDAERVGSDFVLSIYPTPVWDDSNPPAPVGGVTIKNFFAADGNGVIDRANFADGYATLSYQADVLRLGFYTPDGTLVGTSAVGSDGNDSLVGTAASDVMEGEDGNDTLVGLGGADDLEGGTGNDRIDGGTGNDELHGRAGNDTLIGGPGNDTLRGDRPGETGIDTVDVRFANGGVEVDLGQGWAKNGSAASGNANNVGFDLLYGIERVVGSNFGDKLVGNGAANTLSGGDGNDSIIGGAGNDSLLGGAGSDWFDASASSYFTNGRGIDTIDGGVISDLINYSDANTVTYASGAGVRVSLQAGTASDGYGGTDTLRNINFVHGSGANDTLSGSTQLRFESFSGGTGNDVIDGGAITDTLEFRNSNRASFYEVAQAVKVDLRAGTATGQGSDRLININHVRGSGWDSGDTLLGSDSTAFVEIFEGMLGDDAIDGRGGLDMVRYDYARGAVNVNLATGIGSVATRDQDMLAHIEGVRGSHYGDTLTGGNAESAALEFFRGNGGSDRIDGGAGYDRVDYVNSVQGVVVQLGGAAAGSAKDGLPILNGAIQRPGTAGAVIGTDTLWRIEAVRGSDFADTLRGSGIATEETFEGRGGNDQIDGGAGPDRAGYHTARAGVTVKLGLSGAAGTAADGFGGTDTLRNIENVQGSRDFADRITGNELANRLEGQGGNDTLLGGSGADTLLGGAGNDLLAGGSGKDSLTGGTGLDVFRFDTALSATTNVDRVADFVVADDTIQLENAVFTSLTATGTLAAGRLRIGASAADSNDFLVYNPTTGSLSYDADGSGAAVAAVQFATLGTGLALTAADFFVT